VYFILVALDVSADRVIKIMKEKTLLEEGALIKKKIEKISCEL